MDDESSDGSSDSNDLSVGELTDEDSSDSTRKRPDKHKPGKIPEELKRALTENSRDAANDALKRFFSGR